MNIIHRDIQIDTDTILDYMFASKKEQRLDLKL